MEDKPRITIGDKCHTISPEGDVVLLDDDCPHVEELERQVREITK